MSKSLVSLTVAAVGFTLVAAVLAAAANEPKAIEAAPTPAPEPDVLAFDPPLVICHPRITLPWALLRMNPPWCAASEGFYTCWRRPNHGGRHVAYDFTTGDVVAVWPCNGRFPAMEAALYHEVS